MGKTLIPNDYNHFLKEIKQRIRNAQYEALKSVNKEMILLYWDIGSKIVDNQKNHGWGKAVVETLAKDLQREFPGVVGYSVDNLWRMRKFYLRMSKKLGWTKNVLIHQIENQSYEKTLLNQTNFDKTLPEKIAKQASFAVKDDYTFDFLDLSI